MSEDIKRIELTVEEPAGVDRRAWPVTQGVPFADGDLERTAPVRLVTDRGEPLPLQTLCLTTWDKDLRFVKWLLVDFQIDLAAGETRHVFLECGPGVRATPPEQAMRVEHTSSRTRIDTGALQVELRHNDPDFFAACRVRTQEGWRDILRGRPGPYLYMRDQHGTWYDSFRAASPPSIRIEDSGPLRASVCVKGHHASADARRFCPYVLRIHLYAGKTEMRICHTFVFDQDPEQIELQGVGVRIPLDLGDGLRMALGGEGKAHWAGRFARAQLLQASDVEYHVRLDENPFAEGRKTQGWGSLNGKAGACVAALRDMWQEYPKGLLIDRDGIDLQIWPSECGETLKFSTPFKETAVPIGPRRGEEEVRRLFEEHPTAPLNLKGFQNTAEVTERRNAVRGCELGVLTREELLWVEEMVRKYGPERPASYSDTGTSNGFGAAKTTEFVLRLSAERIPDEEAEVFGTCVQEPVLAIADVKYACATQAMRMVAPSDQARFPEVEQGLDSLFERVVAEPRRVLRTFGLVDYGDLVCSHSEAPSAMWNHFKDDPDVVERLKYVARSYNNESNDQVYALWGNFIHAGKRKYFLAAEAYGEHMADVDIVHAMPDGSPGGLMHYHNCRHWTGGLCTSVRFHYSLGHATVRRDPRTSAANQHRRTFGGRAGICTNRNDGKIHSAV